MLSFGYNVLVADGGTEALSICNSYAGDIHLLLTDMVMPGMSGIELKQKAEKMRPPLKFLFMSGYTDQSLIVDGSLESEAAFIEKPFTPNTLGRKVREVLES